MALIAFWKTGFFEWRSWIWFAQMSIIAFASGLAAKYRFGLWAQDRQNNSMMATARIPEMVNVFYVLFTILVTFVLVPVVTVAYLPVLEEVSSSGSFLGAIWSSWTWIHDMLIFANHLFLVTATFLSLEGDFVNPMAIRRSALVAGVGSLS
jgi:hypothetical protein